MHTYIHVQIHKYIYIQGNIPKDTEELKRRVERFSTKIEQTLVAYSPDRNRTATQTAETAAARRYVTPTLTQTLITQTLTQNLTQTLTLIASSTDHSKAKTWI